MNPQKVDILGDIIKLRLQGYTRDQIAQLKPELSNYEVSKYHHEAGEKIRDIQENEVLSTRVTHAQRYNLLYEWFIENDFDDYALKMLEAIEKLLGLHSNTIGLSIHNMIQGTPEKVSLYKRENLTDIEFDRLRELMQKAER